MRLPGVTLKTIIAALLMTGAASCFTGIESTPKITQKHVARENITRSPEQALSDSIRMGTFGDWLPGHALVVTDGKLNRLVDGHADLNPGDTLFYQYQFAKPSIWGDSVMALHLTRPDGQAFLFNTDKTTSQLHTQSSAVIPFTVDLNMIAHARRRLQDMTVYIMTNRWRTIQGADTISRRYVPVTIYDVTAGSERFPLLVHFTATDGNRYAVEMNASDDGQHTRCFADIFSYTDPRLRYPLISDSTWALIQRGKVKEGMTRDECRLSLGAPSDLQRTHNGSYQFERWVYENGAYLIFIDGLLSEYRI